MSVAGEAIPTIQTSETVGALAKALASAQAKIATASKSAINPHFNKSYADLASVWDACREPLTSNGLSVVQLPLTDGTRVGVSTTLLHASGEWMRSTLWLVPERPGPQAAGSCLTYARRYALSAVAGVAPDDDDGNAAQDDPKNKWVAGRGDSRAEGKAPAPNGNQGAPSAATPSPSRTPRSAALPHDGTFASPKQVQLIHVLKAKVGGMSADLYARQLAAFKDCDKKPITTSKDLSAAQAELLINRYQDKIKQQGETAARGFDTSDITPVGYISPEGVKAIVDNLISPEGVKAIVDNLSAKQMESRDLCAIFNVDSVAEIPEERGGDALALVLAYGTSKYGRILADVTGVPQ